MGTLGGDFFFREMLEYCELPVIFLGGWSIKKKKKAAELWKSWGLWHPSLPTCVCSPNPRDILLTSLWLWHLHAHVTGSCWSSFYTLHNFCSHRSLPAHGWKWVRPETFSNMGMDMDERITQSADRRAGRPAVILKGGLYGRKRFSLKQLIMSPRP